MTGTKSKLFFLQGLKSELAHITGTKRGINLRFNLISIDVHKFDLQ